MNKLELLSHTHEKVIKALSEMVLYHGTSITNKTDFQVADIDRKKGVSTCDFGQGFYLTTNYEQAKKRAKNRTEFLKGQLTIKYKYLHIPEDEMPREVVKVYKIDTTNLNQLSLLTFSRYNEEWLNFVVHKRKFFNNQSLYKEFLCKNHTENFDIIYGPLVDGRPKLRYIVKEYSRNPAYYTKSQLLKDISEGFSFPENDQLAIYRILVKVG